MGKQDFSVNRLFEDKEIFADFVNGSLFHGKQVLHADRLELLPSEGGIAYVNRSGNERVLTRRRDICMKADLGVCFAIFAGENQAGVHYAMPVRTMLYDALSYTGQVQELEKRHKEAGDRLKGDEFLSGITKDDRLIPVVTTVLYYGKKWDGSKSLYEMMGLDPASEDIAQLKEYLPDYKIHVFQASDMEDTKIFHTCLQQIFGVLKYKKDKRELYEYVSRNRDELEKMGNTAVLALFSLLGEQKRLEKIWETKKEEEGFSMCEAIDELIQDGVDKGRQEGLEAGENRFVSLVQHLTSENRIDLLEKAAADKNVRQELYLKYGIE